MTLTTRKPTGLPSWPILLIAGAEKAGKTYSAAEASTSDLIGRALFVTVGEDQPDEYGAIPGARFEIVEHDGSYRGILAALTAATAEPSKPGKPNLIVLDSATRLWDLLCDEQQVEANRRAKAKAEKYGRPAKDEDAPITMDQWNVAKQRWGHVIDTFRAHQGPSILTARLEQVTVLDGSGKPTTDRTWKVKAEKSLPYDVGAIVEMHSRGDTYLAGVRSLRFKSEAERTPFSPFTVDDLWRKLGMAEQTGARDHQQVDTTDPDDAAREQIKTRAAELGLDLAVVAGDFNQWSQGTRINDAHADSLLQYLSTMKAPEGVAA